MTSVEQPKKIDAEKSVLGSLIIDPDCYPLVSEVLKPDDFYLQKHVWIFEAIEAVHKQGWALDIVTLTDQLARHERLEEIGGLAYIGDIANAVPSALHVAGYAQIVKDAAIRRQLLRAASEIAKFAYDEETDVIDAQRAAESTVLSVREDAVSATSAQELAGELRDRVAKWRANPGELHGLGTGLDPLDKMLGGLEPGLYILAARTSMGKTAVALQVAANVAQRRDDGHVAFFVIEGSDEQAGLRLATSLAGVPLDKIKRGATNPMEWDEVSNAISEIESWSLRFFSGAVTAGDIRSRVKREMMRVPVSLVVVDYLGLMIPSGETRTRNLELGEIARSLKLAADDLGLPILLLHQLNRGVDNRADKRPVLSDLRESGQIEEHADIVLMLYRAGYYNPHAENANVMEIWVRKNRLGGPSGRRCEMFWNGERMRCEPLSRQEAEL